MRSKGLGTVAAVHTDISSTEERLCGSPEDTGP
jgi:hypothetical protein